VFIDLLAVSSSMTSFTFITPVRCRRKVQPLLGQFNQEKGALGQKAIFFTKACRSS